ncbi:MAG: helix-hairpin-helix domain-containing protein [Chitinispirillaceae bacterium]
MPFIHRSPDTLEKLSILSRDSQYDLACSCGTKQQPGRVRSEDHRWIYPVSLPAGGKTFLFKTLLSNACVNDCKYCPLRIEKDSRRCTLSVEETVRAFLEYRHRKLVSGLFLSSGVAGDPDTTMARLNAVASILRRREKFRGYIHLKVIPGASDAAIEEAVSLASAVSINMEAAGERHFATLSESKNYLDDIVRPMKLISALTQRGGRYSRVRQTTQFVVGAAQESDRELIKYSWGLYKRLNMQRIYYSAYQRGLGDKTLFGEQSAVSNQQLLTREHRLYQVDYLMRVYGFEADEIPLTAQGNLDLNVDPKQVWARSNPDFFPVNVNRATKQQLLRVPGLGPVTVARIFSYRRKGERIRSLEQLGRVGKVLRKALPYVVFS